MTTDRENVLVLKISLVRRRNSEVLSFSSKIKRSTGLVEVENCRQNMKCLTREHVLNSPRKSIREMFGFGLHTKGFLH